MVVVILVLQSDSLYCSVFVRRVFIGGNVVPDCEKKIKNNVYEKNFGENENSTKATQTYADTLSHEYGKAFSSGKACMRKQNTIRAVPLDAVPNDVPRDFGPVFAFMSQASDTCLQLVKSPITIYNRVLK